MNYIEWAQEYMDNALSVLKIIEKKKALLNDKSLSADERKAVYDAVAFYRRIYREQLEVSRHLRLRAGSVSDAE